MSKWEPKEKRIEDIVSAAVEEFLEKGYDGASMEAIARRAGISKGGLYHHFENKEQILFVANEKLSEPVYGFIGAARENPDAIEGLRVYISSYIDHWITHLKELNFFSLTMTKVLACRDMWPAFAGYFDDICGFLSELFARGIREGRLRAHDPSASATALLSALDGILVYLVTNPALSPEEVRNRFDDAFIKPLLTDLTG
jgi:AcrR family transcriptional regulator